MSAHQGVLHFADTWISQGKEGFWSVKEMAPQSYHLYAPASPPLFSSTALGGFSDNNELRFPGLLNVLLRLLWWLQCSCGSVCQRHRSVRAYISSGFGWYWTWFCDHALGFIRKNCTLPDGGERWSFFTAWHSGLQIWSAGSSPGLSSAQAIQF